MRTYSGISFCTARLKLSSAVSLGITAGLFLCSLLHARLSLHPSRERLERVPGERRPGPRRLDKRRGGLGAGPLHRGLRTKAGTSFATTTCT